MTFEVLPAIDVSGGQPAWFQAGQRHLAGKGSVGGLIDRCVTAGAGRVHVVDMDLAFDGELRNAAVVRAAAAAGLAVQAGGGLTTRAEALTFMEAGADRVVLSSGALGQRDRVERLVAELGERLVIGLEVDNGLIRPRGRWAEVRLSLADTLSWLAGVPAARVLMTAISRVGERSGPDLPSLAAVRGALDVPVLVSGGIASVEQIQLVREAGAAGVVVGRAVAEDGADGTFELRDAVAVGEA